MLIRDKVNKADGSTKIIQYKQIKALGKGGFAKCYQVQKVDDKKRLAMKIIPKKVIQQNHSKQKMLSQINLHRSAKHKNIVNLQKVFQDEVNVYILLQLCENQTLYQLINTRYTLTVHQTRFYLYQLIDALCYLHRQNIIHRDVKLGNLLVDANMNLKLGDFGLATKLEFSGDKKHSICGTPNYIAPQVISHAMNVPKAISGHSFQVDVWSVGVILYILLVGEPPFQSKSRLQTYRRVTEANYVYPKYFHNDEAKDLISNILKINPSQRYTFEQILNHPFMNPIKGIPKAIPIQALKRKPNFKQYEFHQQLGTVLQSAKSFIVMNSSSKIIEIDKTDQFQFLSAREIKTSEKDLKSLLLKSSSSMSSLPKSIERINGLVRVVSEKYLKINKSENRNPQPNTKQTISTFQRESIGEINSFRYKESNLSLKCIDDEQIIYVSRMMKEIIWVYKLNNGYIGTYQKKNSLKLLYNPFSHVYLKIMQNKKPQIVTKVIDNQDIENREKYILKLASSKKQSCLPYTSETKLIFIEQLTEIKGESLVFLKLSNSHNQLFDYEKNISLDIGVNKLTMIKLRQNIEIFREQCLQSGILNASKQLKTMFIKAKKIIQKINSLCKN